MSAFSIEKFLTHLIPTSIADAMAQNEILQIVVFAVFFSVALGAVPERSKQLHVADRRSGHIMLKVTAYVMNVRADRGVGGDHGDGGEERRSACCGS